MRSAQSTTGPCTKTVLQSSSLRRFRRSMIRVKLVQARTTPSADPTPVSGYETIQAQKPRGNNESEKRWEICAVFFVGTRRDAASGCRSWEELELARLHFAGDANGERAAPAQGLVTAARLRSNSLTDTHVLARWLCRIGERSGIEIWIATAGQHSGNPSKLQFW